jgi:3-oxoacyl-[acyl-carrier protein] reductase
MGKIILITGASTGIGAETAVELAKDNTIVIHYNASEKPAKETAKKVEEKGGKAALVQADLRTEAGCRKVVDFVSKNYGKLDVLVNNAGGLIQRMKVGEIQWDKMAEIFALNSYSAIMMTSLCVPLLEKGENPCVINLSSIAIRHGAPTATVYAASKGAVDVFTRGAAKELAPKIRVNAVAPGVIETPFHEKVSNPQMLQSWRENTPLKKNGQAYHIASAIKFLIENDFITGETIDVNGGLYMR